MSEQPDPSAGIIARLSAGAELVDQGGFTLDPAVARDKLAQRQLVDPHAWVLLVIEAAELAGAERVEFAWRFGSGTLELHGAAAPALAPVSALEQLFAWVFTHTDPHADPHADPQARSLLRARQLLALAVNAATGGDKRRVSIEVRDSTGGMHMTLAPGRPPKLRARPGGAPRLRIRAKLFARQQGGLAVGLAAPLEAGLLVSRCGYGTVPIFMMGREVPPQPRFVVLAACELELDGQRIGMVGRARGLPSPSWIAVANGVEIESGKLEQLGDDGFVLITAGFERDLSLTKVVRDARLELILAAARDEFTRLESGVRSTSLALRGGSEHALSTRPDPQVAAQHNMGVAGQMGVLIWGYFVLSLPALAAGEFGFVPAAAVFAAGVWLTSAARRLVQRRQLFGRPPQASEAPTWRKLPRGRR